MSRCMRTTLTLDDDVAAKLEQLRHKQDTSLKAVVNEALRLGLREIEARPKGRKPFRTHVVKGSKQLLPSIDNIAEVLALIEGNAFK